MTKEERNAPHSLRDDKSVIIKESDKGSGTVVWDREDYLAEAKNQFDDKEVSQELRGDAEDPIEKIMKKWQENVEKEVTLVMNFTLL